MCFNNTLETHEERITDLEDRLEEIPRIKSIETNEWKICKIHWGTKEI